MSLLSYLPQNITTLGQLCISARTPALPDATENGQCCMCGLTGPALKTNFKDTFTASEFLHATGWICPACYHLYENAEYRACNFIVTRDKFIKLKRPDVFPQILNNQDYPCGIYTTNTYKKQGWIRIVNNLTLSDNLVMAWDMKLLSISKDKLKDFIAVSTFFRDAGFPKSTLNQTPPVSLIKKLPAELQRPAIQFLNKFQDDLNWMWIVGFTTKESKSTKGTNEIRDLLCLMTK